MKDESPLTLPSLKAAVKMAVIHTTMRLFPFPKVALAETFNIFNFQLDAGYTMCSRTRSVPLKITSDELLF